MKAHCNNEKVLARQRDSEFPPASLEAQEFISVPIGTFAGTQDRIVRIRDGRPVPADTGGQAGGKIDRFPAIIAAASAG